MKLSYLLRSLVSLCIFLAVVGPVRAQRAKGVQQASSSGLVLHYTFDQDESGIVTDQSGCGNHGTVVGPEWTADGAVQGAMYFDGLDDRVTIADSESLRPNSEISVMVWVKPARQYSSGDATIVTKEQPGGPGGYNLGYVEGMVRFLVCHQRGYDSLYFPCTLEKDQWYHLAGTYDGTTQRIFINGKKVAERPLAVPLYHTTHGGAVGGSVDWSPRFHFNGVVDDVRIYERGLSPESIADLYRQGLGDGLVLHYTFDQNEGAIVTDQSGCGNHGTVMGSPEVVDGVRGKAFQFDGLNDYIAVPAGDWHGLSDQITMAAWFYVHDTVQQQPIIEWHYGVHMWTQVYGYQWRGRGTGANLGYGCCTVVSMYDPPPGWHHLVVTCDGAAGVGRVYLDGVLGAARQWSPFMPQTSPKLYVGHRDDSPDIFYRGLLDDVRIYKRVLDAGEVAALYAGGDEEEKAPLITSIGFSNDPDGDQDVTEFLNDETLHICVKDVDLDAADPACSVLVIVFQKKKWSDAKRSRRIRLLLDPQEDGSFKGAVPLDQLGVGKAEVQILGSKNKGKERLQRTGYIFINAAP